MDFDLDLSVCCIKGCDKPSVALGLCINHWRRNKKYGSPVASVRHGGMFKGKSQAERFKMQYKESPSGCWEWVGSRDVDGYGLFKGDHLGQIFKKAHRWSFAFHNDQTIPEGTSVCHSCDNPSCVNPAHLWLGSTKENQQDKWKKGRGGIRKGEDSQHAKITNDQALAILSDPRPYARIAADYGLSAGTVGNIKNRDSWASLGDVEVVKHKRVSPRKGVSDKITPDIVREIRSSNETGKAMAEKFGITPQTVCDIRKRRSWAHIE